jgi:prefoldin alpha subunit
MQEIQDQQAAESVYQDWIQRVQYLEKLLEDTDMNINNINILKEQMNSMSELNENEEILAPIANGIFVNAKLTNVKTLKVNVGRGIMVDKTIPETIELIEKQEIEVHAARKQIMAKLEEMYQMANQY